MIQIIIILKNNNNNNNNNNKFAKINYYYNQLNHQKLQILLKIIINEQPINYFLKCKMHLIYIIYIKTIKFFKLLKYILI